MPPRRTDPLPMTEQEARRRLGAAYAILLDLAAKRRTAQTQPTTKQSATDASDRHDDRPATI